MGRGFGEGTFGSGTFGGSEVAPPPPPTQTPPPTPVTSEFIGELLEALEAPLTFDEAPA